MLFENPVFTVFYKIKYQNNNNNNNNNNKK